MAEFFSQAKLQLVSPSPTFLQVIHSHIKARWEGHVLASKAPARAKICNQPAVGTL